MRGAGEVIGGESGRGERLSPRTSWSDGGKVELHPYESNQFG